MSDEYLDEKTAIFNEALAMVVRLDTLIRRVQDSKPNPFLINEDFSVPNYELRVSSLWSHWQEIMPYCSNEEKIYVERWKVLILYLKSKLIKKEKNNIRFDFNIWNDLDKYLEILEGVQRRLQLVHGLSNPLKDNRLGL